MTKKQRGQRKTVVDATVEITVALDHLAAARRILDQVDVGNPPHPARRSIERAFHECRVAWHQTNELQLTMSTLWSKRTRRSA